jgi:2-polyprenyl-3-methyl-5-hydroxy-6-metoxy-1,4-benzoquinol methylase
MNNLNQEVREFWNRVAADWDIQVGENGDSNRVLNSDPILRKFMGEIQNMTVLDAGCGTGYLSRQLATQGAVVTGIDLSENMIAIAQEKSAQRNLTIDFYVDDCSKLEKLSDQYFDLVIANYVLMDVPDLEGAMNAFNRVLKVNSNAILIFSHPCFPQGKAKAYENNEEIQFQYNWNFSYFERHKCIESPWGHFTDEFIWFHRPLSDYWKAFKSTGFTVIDFEEPRLTEERFNLAENKRQLQNGQTRPNSVAFKLQKLTSLND